MIINMYSIYDTKGLNYSPPFLAATDGLAVRMLQEAVSDPQTMVSRHPADFKLYLIGRFNDQNAGLLSVDPPSHVIDAVALVATQPKLPLEEAAQ